MDTDGGPYKETDGGTERAVYHVVCAAIVEEGMLFAVRHVYDTLGEVQKFELVGGSVTQSGEFGDAPEKGEAFSEPLKKEFLRNECMDEYGMEITVGDRFASYMYEYPDYTVNMTVYFCRRRGPFALGDHEEQVWIPCDELDADDWIPDVWEALSALKSGMISFDDATGNADVMLVSGMGGEYLKEVFGNVYAPEKLSYMTDRIFSPGTLKSNAERGEIYRIIRVYGEPSGFYSYFMSGAVAGSEHGAHLSQIYLKKYARNKKITDMVLNSLPRPVTVSVDNENGNAVALFKYLGFRIKRNETIDLGEGFATDNFLMELD